MCYCLNKTMNGILLIDKPQNFTSFDVVALVRKLTKQKKVGHAGTLDPMATGVLPILLNEATKIQSIFPNSDKEYLASFRIGITTDTQDITGKIISTQNFSVTKTQMLDTIKKFCGEIKQTPPMFSALKQNGTKLYDLARKGITIPREPRTIFIKKIDLISFNQDSGDIQILVSCSKGTYIRTLCHDIGTSLGCGASLTSLRRTYACGFHISQTISIQDLKNLITTNELIDHILPIETVFLDYPQTKITMAQTVRFLNGGSLSLDRITFRDPVENENKIRVYSNENSFLGLGIVETQSNQLKIFKLFKKSNL